MYSVCILLDDGKNIIAAYAHNFFLYQARTLFKFVLRHDCANVNFVFT